ncbi:MAG: DedA family protein [Acidobacteria bacterium]|nr:DedA family protein [Acidobacteriota bacterium]
MAAKLIALFLGLSLGARYGIVLLLMAVQSACIPIPSEVIMPMAGYALAHTQAQLILLATLASLASNVGSYPAYWVGAKGGRPMVEKYGRYLLLSHRDLDLADKFFTKYGSITVLVGRMLPIVRTFIAFPAGIARMNQVRFQIYTFVGSFPWCYALAYIGMKLGARWNSDPRFKAFFNRFHLGVELVLVVGIAYFVWTHWQNRAKVVVG